ncbi:hypothetical protein PG993_013798 [Apiospora rasikravindrae]|uniref:DUF6594 domain-containing protein n=1 Tax=Apiospora rasikravindrae TaxID=990691 RepID=A0ABR1RRI5_9PEZI
MASETHPIGSRPPSASRRDYYKPLLTPNGFQPQPKNLDRFPELYPDEDVLISSRTGWSWIAARERHFVNEDFHRGFHYPTNRCLLYYEQRITCLYLRLYELEKDEDEETLCQLSFDPEEFLAQFCGIRDPPLLSSNNGQPSRVEANKPGTTKPDEAARKRMKVRENLIQALDEHLRKYCQVDLLNSSQAVQTKPRVSREQHYAFYKRMKRKNILTESASQYLCHRDDFVTLNPHVIHQRFEGLLYTSRPYLWEIAAFFRQCLCSFCRCFELQPPSRSDRDEHDPEYDYDAGILEWLSRFLLAPTVAALLLVPVAILFFVKLSKAAEFGVVLTFVALFVLTISCFERSTVKIIIGVCAFEAVLAAFLAK